MINALTTLRAYLAENASVAAVFGKRIYALQDLPGAKANTGETGYDPQAGPACLIAPRAGPGQAFHNHAFSVSMQIRVYGKDEAAAWSAFGTIYDALNDVQSGNILWARLEDGTHPIPLSEPEVGWRYVMGFFMVHVRG